MRNTLPTLTKFLCSRRETHWGIWLGAGALTIPYQLTVLAVPQDRIVLPIITSLVLNINSVHNWQDTHMITATILWILIVLGFAYSRYLLNQLKR